MTLRLLLALVLATAAAAAPYQHPTLNFALDLPAGWTPTGAEDANPAQLSGADGVSVRVRVTPRPQELTPALAARIAQDDLQKIAVKFPRSKAFPMEGPKLSGLPSHHYAILYIDAASHPKVVRFAMASRPSSAGFQWIKFQFSYGRMEHSKVTPVIDGVLRSFRFVEAPVVARISTPDRGAVRSDGDLNAVIKNVDPATAAQVLSAIQPAAEAPAPPAGEQMDADSAYYLSMNQKMSEAETQQHVATFKAGGPRTEEEQARARSYGMGDIFKPNE